MNTSCRELTFPNILSDSLVRTVMAADGIDPREFSAMLGDIARKLETREQRRMEAVN